LAGAGIREIAIVVGHLAEEVVHYLGDGSEFGVKLHYLINSDYLSGNAISVQQAKEWAQGNPVVLCMGDHVIGEKLVRRLLDSQTFTETLCIDRTLTQHHKIEEATKVAVDIGGCIKNIGKELGHWDAVDTGVFLITDDFFKAVDELVQSRGTDIETADIIRFLVGGGHQFYACDVSGCFWMDVDTPEDLNLARSM
jgi:choline kinase